MELNPRITISCVAPGCPEDATDCRPATFPCNALSTEVKGVFSISADFTVETEPVNVAFLVVPYPTTTTSCRVEIEAFN